MTKANTVLETTETVERAAANTEVAMEPSPKFIRPCRPCEREAEPAAGCSQAMSLSTSTPSAARTRSISGRRSASRGATVRAEAMSSGTSIVTAMTATPAMAMSTSTMLTTVTRPG